MPKRRMIWVLLCTVALGAGLFASPAYAAKAAQGVTSAGLIKSASMVGPMGLNPFFAIAAFGIAAEFGLWELPAGLEVFGHPAFYLGFLVLGILLQFGRSLKLTKPIAEALGTGESLFAIVAVSMMMLPHFESATPVTEAGFGTGALMLLAGLSSVIALIILRTALDVMIWLSPIPFVDSIFQVVKLVLTIGLVALAIASPPVAIVVNLIILVATALAVRWAIRTARFGAIMAYDLTIGRFKKTALPKDEVAAADLGPFVAFAMDVPGFKKRTRVALYLEAGRWFVIQPTFRGNEQRTPLGDDRDSVFRPGWMGTDLTLPQGKLLLAPRYRHLVDEMVRRTHSQLETPPENNKRLHRAAQAMPTAP